MTPPISQIYSNPFLPKPNTTYTNVPGDTLMNPYAPPLQPPLLPINVPTNIGYTGFASYRQVGILTPHNKRNSGNYKSKSKTTTDDNHHSTDRILPLMARPLFTNRDKWQYYTMSDQNNSIKLPIVVKGRDALNEYGVDKLYDRDIVFVEGYNQGFQVTVYDNNALQYMPSYI